MELSTDTAEGKKRDRRGRKLRLVRRVGEQQGGSERKKKGVKVAAEVGVKQMA